MTMLFTPVIGVILMWLFASWPNGVKITVTFLFLVAPIILITTYIYIAQPFKISGRSMAPSFETGQTIVASKFNIDPIGRGDVIVFKNPKLLDQDFVGRVVGLPDEEIMVKGGGVYINGQILREPYLVVGAKTNPGTFLPEGGEYKTPSEAYMVMGDNRDRSSDSRAYGFVRRDLIIGKYWFKY